MAMIVSLNWLKTWVPVEARADKIAQKLTMAGLEVDAVRTPPALSQVVVGEVLETAPHPQADRLKVCQVVVDPLQPPLEIVCGCPTVAPGMKVPVALHGAQLPGGHKIKRSKLRGVTSHGMLCSEVELGLASESDGLMALPADAPIGEDFVAYAGLDDSLIEVDLTPNRGDCLSIQGVAREVAANFELAMTPVEIAEVALDNDVPQKSVELVDTAACPRYLATVVMGVDMHKPTPFWMQQRLRSAGLRLVNVVVDIANYVMIELGQPLHAFDYDTLDGALVVRAAHPGEKLMLLDGVEVALDPTTLVIADQQGPQAIAGVMGGLDSGVTEKTQHVLIESAHFAPVGIARTCRQSGLHSDAAHRFERGVDRELPRVAMQRMLGLLQSICGGNVGETTECSVPARELLSTPIRIDAAEIKRILGVEMAPNVIDEIFNRLALPFDYDGQAWSVMPPSYRFDLKIPADLIEEIARVYGYDKIPTQHLPLMPAAQVDNDRLFASDQLRDCLAQHGLHEAVTYSFIAESYHQACSPEIEACRLANPLSANMAVMRASILPGLLEVAERNLRRQHPDVRLFEIGLCFEQHQGQGTVNIKQRQHVAGLLCGARQPEQWGQTAEMIDFYDAKGICEQVLTATQHAGEFSFVAGQHAALHPGKTAQIMRADQQVGVVGMIHPQLADQLQLPQGIAMFELYDIDQWNKSRSTAHAVSKFPCMRRDLSLLVNAKYSFGEIAGTIRQIGGELLQNVVLFDIYQGQHIAADHKSLGVGLSFQHQERTLVEQEVTALVTNIVDGLQQAFNITVRDK